MLTLVAFLVLGLVCLSLLGHLSAPRSRRPPPREWTPVYLADQVGVGLRVLFDAGADRARRLDELVDEDRRRQERHRRGGTDGDEGDAGQQPHDRP